MSFLFGHTGYYFVNEVQKKYKIIGNELVESRCCCLARIWRSKHSFLIFNMKKMVRYSGLEVGLNYERIKAFCIKSFAMGAIRVKLIRIYFISFFALHVIINCIVGGFITPFWLVEIFDFNRTLMVGDFGFLAEKSMKFLKYLFEKRKLKRTIVVATPKLIYAWMNCLIINSIHHTHGAREGKNCYYVY